MNRTTVSQHRWSQCQRRSAEAALERIVADVCSVLQDALHTLSGNFADGTAGLAVMLAYASRAGYCDERMALVAAEHAIESADGCTGVGVYQGACGIAFALDEVRRVLGLDYDPVGSFDTQVLSAISSSPDTCASDLTAGVVGIGLYALARPESPTRDGLLDLSVNLLARRAISSTEGVTWPFGRRGGGPTEETNFVNRLGLAHGNAGAMGFLAKARLAGVTSPLVDDLLRGSVSWSTRHCRRPGEPLPRIPVGWCWGDLGVATGLWWAATALADSRLREFAKQMARSEADREPDERAPPQDACMCHGSAGIAQMFHRWYGYTEEAAFAVGVDRWIEHLLRQRGGRGIGGFEFFASDPNTAVPYWYTTPGILSGSAGVALALLSFLHDDLVTWDSIFLLS